MKNYQKATLQDNHTIVLVFGIYNEYEFWHLLCEWIAICVNAWLDV